MWRQIDSLMDDSSEDFRDLGDEFDTNVLTVGAEANIAGSLTVAGTTTLASLTANSLLLPSFTPSNTTNLLYNTAGDLYWQGNLIAGGVVGNWVSNGSDVYRLTGNVGIGTNSPSARFQINDSNLGSTFRLLNPVTNHGLSFATSWPGIQFNTYSNGVDDLAIGNGYSGILYLDPTQGDFQFLVGDNPGNNNVVTNRAALTIKNNGNVGIGSSNPVAQLEVVSENTDFTRGIVSSQYNEGLQSPFFIGRKARGSQATPGSVITSDFLVALGSQGFGASNFSLSQQAFSVQASEDWTDTAQGTDIAFWTTPNGGQFVQERMRILNNGNVGIGKNNPMDTLDVNGVISNSSYMSNTDGFYVQSGNQYNTANGINNNLGDGLSFRTNGVDNRMVITNSGNVGIGTNNPRSDAQLTLDNINNGFSRLQMRVNGTNSGGIYSDPTTFSIYNNSTSTNATIRFDLNGLERMRILDNGNVGIGVTNPGNALEVAGNIGATSDGFTFLSATTFADAGSPAFIAQRARGSQASPTAVLAEDALFDIQGRGWDGSGFDYTTSHLLIRASENFTSTNQGSYLTFQTVPNGTATGIERLRITDGGNVGIGAINPQQRLTVDGTFRAGQIGSGSNEIVIDTLGVIRSNKGATNYQAHFVASNGSYTDVGSITTDGDVFSLSTGGLPRLNITQGGNIGIGTATPSERLDVAGRINLSPSDPAYGSLKLNTGGEDHAGYIDWYKPGGDRIAYLGFKDGGIDNLGLNLQAGADFIIDGGNVGIGTSNPVNSFTVVELGSLTPSDIETYGVNFFQGNVPLAFGGDNNYSYIQSFNGSPLIINHEGNDTLFNILGGNVGIATTTPSARLTVSGTVRFATITGGTLQTDSLGNVTASSDERLKDIDGEYTAGIEEILGLEPIQYNWTLDSGFDTETLYAGFSAQNVQEFLPAAVGQNPDGFLTLSDRPIIAALVNAVKEVWERLTGVESRVDELEQRVLELEAALNQSQSQPSSSSGSSPSEPTAGPVSPPVSGDTSVGYVPAEVPPQIDPVQ